MGGREVEKKRGSSGPGTPISVGSLGGDGGTSSKVIRVTVGHHSRPRCLMWAKKVDLSPLPLPSSSEPQGWVGMANWPPPPEERLRAPPPHFYGE